MEQNDQSEQQPGLFQSPSMKIWLLVALNFACIGIFVLLNRIEAFSWLSAGPENGSPAWMGKVSAAIYTVIVFILPAVIFANAAISERFYFFKLQNRVRLLPAILGVFAMLAATFMIDLIYTWNQTLITDPELIELERISELNSNWMLEMPGVGALLLCLFANAFIPALAEEMFFRGGIQQLTLRWIKNKHVAILLAAAFFSFLHFDVTGFVARFILGAFLGYLFYWSGSLRLPILAHFAFNAFSIVNSYVVQHAPESFWSKMETTIPLGIISLVVSVGALLTCRNLLKPKIPA